MFLSWKLKYSANTPNPCADSCFMFRTQFGPRSFHIPQSSHFLLSVPVNTVADALSRPVCPWRAGRWDDTVGFTSQWAVVWTNHTKSLNSRRCCLYLLHLLPLLCSCCISSVTLASTANTEVGRRRVWKIIGRERKMLEYSGLDNSSEHIYIFTEDSDWFQVVEFASGLKAN